MDGNRSFSFLRASGRGRCFVRMTAALWLLSAAAFAQDPKPPIDRIQQRAEGQKLFLHNWLKAGRLNGSGNGFGPMYNDVSCVACHKQGGVGGSAKVDKNVDILSLWRPPMTSSRPVRIPRKLAQRAADKIHPLFLPQAGGLLATPRTSLTLHKHGGTDLATREKYKVFRYNLTKPLNSRFQPPHWRSIRRMDRVRVEFTQRNTPALFGAGLIDRIPDSVIIETANRQRKQHKGITGRIPQTLSGAIARFGWRGQTATLHDFVLGACANELGLTVPTVNEPAYVRWDKKDGKWKAKLPPNRSPSDQKPFLDLTDKQCQSLTAFVASLPSPQRSRKLPLSIAKDVHKGEKLFTSVGCAVCHVPDMKPAVGIYSDLLLHDMGPKLSDPLSAVPEINEKTAPGFVGTVGYYGSESLPQFAKITTNVPQEWRTPPLWGVADSGPWLHDGRAKTLADAILWHDGESRGAARNYKRLGKKDRERIVMFLQSLVAPGSTTQPGGFGRGGRVGSSGFFSVSPTD